METGDHLINFSLASTLGEPIEMGDLVGKAVLLFFYNRAGDAESTRFASALCDHHQQFDAAGIMIIGIGAETEAANQRFADAMELPFPLLADPEARLGRKFGITREHSTAQQPSVAPLACLISPDSRIAAIFPYTDTAGDPSRIIDQSKRILLREQPRQMISHAPVLLIPNVLPPSLCQDLMNLWETDNGDSGFMRQIDGQTVGVYDYSHKIRRDHFIQPGEMQNRVQGYIGARVIPQIRKAFNYSVTRREDYRIACYDSSKGGFFRPHRDNTTDGTAHRRFAMSLLLNNEYEGGYLRFPEYGLHTYRPEAGGAVIFSCSLLHEATDVTAGRRFVLLSFLYGEAEAKVREEYNRRSGGNYKA